MTALLAVEFTSADAAMTVAIAVLIFIAALTALAETSIVRISKAKAVGLREEGKPGSKALAGLVQSPERWINALLLVMLVCQIVQATLTGVVASSIFGPWGVVAATFFNVVVMFVVAEAAPKTWALQNPERAALLSARPVAMVVDFAPLRLVSRALIGLTNIVLPGKGLKEGPWVSEEELLAVAAEAHESNVIDTDERRLIESIIEFGDTVAREVMVPRPDMVTVNSDFRVADVMEVVLLNGYSRIPVLGAGIDDVIGLVFAKDLMRAERDGREAEEVGNLVRAAREVPETKPVAELLREMQADQFHMAIVIDEHGGTAGLVTLEDLIEELVGEIVDEFDIEDARVEPVAGGSARVSGRLSIDDANDLLDVELPEGDFDTVGGLVLAELGRLAVPGDVAELDEARLVVERVQGRRIMRVRIEKVVPPISEPEAIDDKASRRAEKKADKADRADRADAANGGTLPVKSGFVTLVGRPNVGKSTLLNKILGQKVTIVSDKPQTTRTQVRGVLTRPDAQVVFVDTPGIHKPRTLLGERLNDAADAAIGDVDVVCLLVDATMPIGPGDKWIAQRVPTNAIIVVNKTDIAEPTEVLSQLHAAAEQLAGGDEYFPISAKTGAGVPELLDALLARLPEGPSFYPDDMVTDVPEAFWVAELVREQLLAVTHDEVPHSVAARVTEWEWPRIRVEILVERDSQKGIVIGKKGAVLKEVGTNVRKQLPPGAFIELFVKVDKDWQRKPRALERLGY